MHFRTLSKPFDMDTQNGQNIDLFCNLCKRMHEICQYNYHENKINMKVCIETSSNIDGEQKRNDYDAFNEYHSLTIGAGFEETVQHEESKIMGPISILNPTPGPELVQEKTYENKRRWLGLSIKIKQTEWECSNGNYLVRDTVITFTSTTNK